MSFLKKIWDELRQQREKNKGKQNTQNFQKVYEDFRSIYIQSLDLIQIPKSNPIIGSTIWVKQGRIIHSYKQNCKATKLSENGFFDTFYNAYINHGELKIKPDDIWLAIMLWFTKYVDQNSEQLRKAFVSHDGKKTLVVKTLSESIQDWDEFFEGIIVQIQKNTLPGIVQKLQCNFTSTNLFDRVFSTAIIMNSFKKYFDYQRQGGGCGILKVHMGGVLQDWEKLIRKLNALKQFDVDGELNRYVKGLEPVLEQFVETYKGNAHLKFWNNIYHQRVNPLERAYGPVKKINGWLIKFFTTQNQVSGVLQLQDINVPIKFTNLRTGVVKMLEMVGGCKGYRVENKSVYQPHFSFAICENKVKKFVKNYNYVVPERKVIEKIFWPLKIVSIGNVGLQKQKKPKKQTRGLRIRKP